MTPMPHEEEASTQNSTGEIVRGLERREPQNSNESWERHQLISERTAEPGDQQMKVDVK